MWLTWIVCINYHTLRVNFTAPKKYLSTGPNWSRCTRKSPQRTLLSSPLVVVLARLKLGLKCLRHVHFRVPIRACLATFPVWGGERCVQSAWGIITRESTVKMDCGFADRGAREMLKVCGRNKPCSMQVRFPRTKAINKALKQSWERRNRMSQPSETGYGINPFGKARSPHTSTT